MPEVITFISYRPPERFDELPWTEIRVEEAAAEDGTYTLIDTIPISPLDADPTDPAYQSFTTENGTDVELWYRVVFADADGDTSQPTTPVQNVAGSTGPPVVAYATTTELARVLQLSSPTPAQTVALQRCLDAAATEIDSYLAPDAPYFAPYPALVVQVNLERAVEHWKQEQSPFGIVVLGGETAPGYTSRNSWRRHANTLLPLKTSFGVG
jgi:hypothetical protein